MNSQKEFCNEIIKLIKENPSEIVFFTGAGISYNPPSSLPLANDIKLELIETICKNGEKTSINQFYQLHQCQIKEYLKNISMESIFEIIKVRSELDVIKMIMRIFSAKEPNNNHAFLAKLLQKGCEVITTNFDEMIEKMIEKETQICKEIMHLHGFIREPQSIITTLHQVGQGLPEEKRKRFEEKLEGKKVVFIGWSDKDIDITPVLFLIKNIKIFWIDHNTKIAGYDDHEIKESNDLIDKLIRQFNGIKCVGNTDKIIKKIWQGLWDDEPKPLEEARSQEWKEPIKDLENLREWDRADIFLEVLERIDPKKTFTFKLIEILENDLRKEKDFSESDKQRIFYELSCKKSVCNRIISNYGEAIKSAENAIESIKFNAKKEEWLIKSYLIELKNDVASAYNDWGSCCGRNGFYKEGIKKHKKAIEIFKENIRELEIELNQLTNIDKLDNLIILMKLDKAQVHTNLGSTFFDLYCSRPQNSFNGLLNEAENNYREGIKIHEELQEDIEKFQKDIRGMLGDYNSIKLGDIYNNIANVYSQKSEKENAKNYYEKCLKIKNKSGDVRGKKRLLGDYLSFIEENKFLKPENMDAMRTEYDILKSVFVEETISSTHLLYYKKKLADLF